jgi:two-component system cell cycle sensor histidine kinase/response regulator CckA
VRPFQELTLMVVEDEDLLRQAVVKMLRKVGFDIVEAASGSTTIEFLRARGRRIDLILLDATIPGASSEDVVNVAAKEWPDARVIMTSAYSQELIAGMKRAPQIHDFIRKPFEFGDLVQALRRAAEGMGPKLD